MIQLRIRNEILEDHVVPLRRNYLLVGRDREVDLRLPDPSVSRFHARLEVQPGDRLLVVDLGSRNGTFLNGERVVDLALAGAGDVLVFGTVRVQLEQMEKEAPEHLAARAPSRDALVLRRRIKVVLAFASLVLVFGVLATQIWFGGEQPQGRGGAATSLPEDFVRPRAGEAAGGALPPPELQPTDPPPPPDPPPDEGGAEAQIAPGVSESEDEPAPQTLWPPSQVRLRAGEVLLGHIVAEDDPLHLVLRVPGREGVLRIPQEEVAAVDGKPWEVDLRVVYQAKLALAGDVPRLLELSRWCALHGLDRERLALAERVVQIDPGNPEAHAILGRFRYRGQWQTRQELQEVGVLGPGDVLVGTDQDLWELRRLHLDLLGRPPLPEEAAEALAVGRETLVDRLLRSRETWEVWLSDQREIFLGREGAVPDAAPPESLVLSLAAGDEDLRTVFRWVASASSTGAPPAADWARRMVATFLGPVHLGDASLVANAGRMAAGERTAVFGERGSSGDDLLEIVLRHPDFYRALLDREALRLRGESLGRAELTRAAFRLAAAPRSLAALHREWLLDPQWPSSLKSAKRKNDAQFIRGLLVDLTGRLPDPPVVQGWRSTLGAFSGHEGLRAVAGSLLAGSLAPVPPAEMELGAREWVQGRIRTLLARSPSVHEEEAALEIVKRYPRGQALVLLALLLSSEYQLY